jgi:hypothetical protein
MDIQNIIRDEIIGSIDFFLNYTNLDSGSKGYGLCVDSTKTPQLASIAAVGFALTAWVIASERGHISRERAADITKRTLHTLLHHADHQHGFFAHFLHMDSGMRIRKCEFSTIDTSICLNGVITAAAYYHDTEIDEMAQQLLARVDWNFIIFENNGKTLFHMAYNPDLDGDYVSGEPGFISQWSMAAEQKMMYLQAAAQIEPSVAMQLYRGFSRDIGMYDGHEIIVNPGGNLFAYQFSKCWFDSGGYLDADGIDWFNNTRLAVLANRNFCMQNAQRYKSYHANSWGLSAGDSPCGYDVSGSPPCLQEPRLNGTVSIYTAIASLPFAPQITLELIDYLYHQQPKTWGRYGFFDAYNLDVTPEWYSHSLYGIDKGCSMIMIENYLTRLVWDIYTTSPTIQKSLAVLGFTRKEGQKDEQILRTERPILAG